MTMMQNTELVKESVNQFERITNPILALLIIILLMAIIAMYRYFNRTIDKKDVIIGVKDAAIEKLNGVLQEVRHSDAILISELTNTLKQFTDIDKHYTDKLGTNNDLIQQLITKVDIMLKLYKNEK
jgi:hypothetical protein